MFTPSQLYIGTVFMDNEVLSKYPMKNEEIGMEVRDLHTAMCDMYYRTGEVTMVDVIRKHQKSSWCPKATDMILWEEHAMSRGLARSYRDTAIDDHQKDGIDHIIRRASQMNEKCEPNETIGWLQSEIISLTNVESKKIVSLDDATPEWFSRIAMGEESNPRIKTGNYVVDEDLRITDGGLHIIAGRPGLGKTTLCTWFISQFIHREIPVLFFSLEMPKTQLLDKFYKLWTGELTPEIADQVQEKRKMPLYIDDTPGHHIDEMYAKAIMCKKLYNIQCIVVDYLQLIRSPTQQSREREVSYATSRLKQLARTLEIPVIVACQINREVERHSSTSKRPMLSHLRESGAIEQDADSVSFIYRPAYYYNLEKKPIPAGEENACEIIIAKQRTWKTRTLTCSVDLARGDFTEWGEDFTKAKPLARKWKKQKEGWNGYQD